LTDIIERYCDVLVGGSGFSGLTDAPRDYQEASALFLMSTFAGSNFKIMSAAHTSFKRSLTSDTPGTKLLNLWFLLIGKSRWSRKTVSVSKAIDALDDIAPDIRLPDDYTPSAAIMILSRRPKGSTAAWVQDECSLFFDKLRAGDYMAGIDALLSALYDGRKYRRETVSRASEEVEELYLTILLASTDQLPSSFHHKTFRQGFLNRFLFIVDSDKSRKSKPEREKAVSKKEANEIVEILEWMAALADFSPTKPIIVKVDAQAKKILDRLTVHTDKVSKAGLERRKQGWVGNVPNFAIRLATIRRMARLDISYFQQAKPSSAFLVVEEKDMIWAIDYLTKCEKWLDIVIELMDTPDDDMYSAIMRKIRMHGDVSKITGKVEITRSKLLTRANVKARDLDQILAPLLQEGKVTTFMNGKTTFYSI
jgi:hypothetical protein